MGVIASERHPSEVSPHEWNKVVQTLKKSAKSGTISGPKDQYHWVLEGTEY